MLMKDIYRLFRKLDFSEYGSFPDFEIYKIEGEKYDFTDNLGFPENQDGVYIFLNEGNKLECESECKMDVLHLYELLYCGKTKDLRTRFCGHNHQGDLKKYNPLFIAVSYCENEEEITDLEKKMLSKFRFKYNDPETNKVLIAGVKL